MLPVPLRLLTWFFLLALPVFFSACSTPLRSPAAAAPDFFTVIALPDTQNYSAHYPETFRAQMKWIADQRDRLNIQLVVGLGDIVDDGSDERQWANAEDAVSVLDSRVPDLPYVLAIGNHDYDVHQSINASHRRATRYNRHFGAGRIAARKQGWVQGTFEAGHAENSYSYVRLGGQDWILLSLEFNPRDSVLGWADRVLTQNAERPALVVTHSYGFSDDTLNSMCDAYEKRVYSLSADNNGDEMWERLLRHHANVRWVLSGHIPFKGTGRRTDLNDAGIPVHQLLSDFQEEGRGGDGYLRILTFRPAEGRAEVSTYSPVALPAVRADRANQFQLPLQNYDLPAPRSAVLRGVVKSGVEGQGCRRISGIKVRWPGGSTMTDSQGRFKITAKVTRAFEPIAIELRGPGWAAARVQATIRVEDSPPQEVYLTKSSGSSARPK